MSKASVIVLGGSGMLGSMIVDVLTRDTALEVTATVRSQNLQRICESRLPDAVWRVVEAGRLERIGESLAALPRADWIINAIGLTKPYVHDNDPAEVERAILVNSLFPGILAQALGKDGTQIVQIATDCTYSGAKGGYLECDKHDALDVYGKTKSLGETRFPNVHHLRCSIVGPEPKTHTFLLEWFLRQLRGAQVSGFTNHAWNGVSTLHFAKLCRAIIRQNIKMPWLHHVVPCGAVSKYELLCCFAGKYGRQDITIKPSLASLAVDRTLGTENVELNALLWRNAGYAERPPTIPEMVEEMAGFSYRMKELA